MTIRGTFAVGAALLGMVGFQALLTGFGRPVIAPAESLSHETTTTKSGIPHSGHPDWILVSGEIAETVIMKPDGQPDQLLALLQPVEGGRLGVDLGPADVLDRMKLEPQNLIHVWGSVLTHGTARTVVAGEVMSEGKVFQIERQSDPVLPLHAQSANSTPSLFRHTVRLQKPNE